MIVLIWYSYKPKSQPQQEKEYPLMLCINLETETKKKQHIKKVFQTDLGLKVKFIKAIDTRENKWKNYTNYLTKEGLTQLNRSISDNYRLQHHELTQGAIGCFLSHLKCWTTFLYSSTNNDEFVFILEDDSKPSPKFKKAYDDILDYIPYDADIFLFSFITMGHKERMKTKNGININKLKNGSRFYLLNAYMIRRRAIEKIMKHLRQNDMKFDKQIDSYLTDLMNTGFITVYTFDENICPQIYMSPTTIQTLVMKDPSW